MGIFRSVQTCRWGTPTISLEWPWWYDASVNEWSCMRDGSVRTLDEVGACRTCPRWAPAPSEALGRPHDEPRHQAR